jgi:hypothetical protein
MIASARLGIPCSVKKARRLRAPFAHGHVDGSRHAGGDAGREKLGEVADVHLWRIREVPARLSQRIQSLTL